MNKLKELRKYNKFTQCEIAKKLKISQQTYSNYESESTEAPHEILKQLAQIFDVSVDYLLGNDNNKNSTPTPKPNRIPVLGKIPAGIPINMIEDILDYEEIDAEKLTGGKEYFALKVQGDSMYPKFQDGDVLIVKKQDDCENGTFAVVAVNGDDATFKKVIKKADSIILQPLNDKYEPIIYNNEQIQKLPVRILGVVVEIRRTI